ncbi:MAG TPA: cellulose synthase subunit BcsC-related outer membrane protein, partial [Herbaspirillum sp.]|nr:cellulose synthase subunit BcsC-related outer membrane protein [Herbaspirillum sp.]
GGVVRTGIDTYASKDIGKNTLFIGMGAGVFTGRNVETNQGETLRTGIDIPLFTSLNWHLNSGLVGSYEHYAKNLRFYTFGQGGYYSPQRYLSLSVPIDWTARLGKASWGIHTSLGFSHTGEADSPFFPTDASLQNSALANSVNNVNTGSAGGGFSYSFSAIFQYELTQNLAGGLNIAIDRSRSYAPSTAMVYLRYLFNPGRDPVKYPSAVTPYSDF